MASVAKRIWAHNGVEKEAWIVRYKDVAGKHRQRTFQRKKLADAYCLEVMNELNTGLHVPKSADRTFASILGLYEDELAGQVLTGNIRRSTREERIYRLRARALPEFGGVKLQSLTGEMAVAWYRKLVGEGLDIGTAVNYVQLACQVLDFAVKRGWVRSNAFREFRKSLKIPRRRIETFTPDEVRQLLVLVSEKPLRGRRRGHRVLECAVHLAACCGMRWGEIFALRRADVDLVTGRIQIRQGIDRWGNLGKPKTDYSVRDLHAPEHIRALLARFMEEHPSNDPDGVILTRAAKAGTGMGKRPTKKADREVRRREHEANGRRFDNSNFQVSYWKPLLLRAGFPPIETKALDGKVRRKWRHFHSLRHFAASFMIDSDWTIPEVSRQLGHADAAITLRVYSHVLKTKEQTGRAFEALAQKLLNGGQSASL